MEPSFSSFPPPGQIIRPADMPSKWTRDCSSNPTPNFGRPPPATRPTPHVERSPLPSTAFWTRDNVGVPDEVLLLQLRPSSEDCGQRRRSQRPQPGSHEQSSLQGLPSFGARTAAAIEKRQGSSDSSGSVDMTDIEDEHQQSVSDYLSSCMGRLSLNSENGNKIKVGQEHSNKLISSKAARNYFCPFCKGNNETPMLYFGHSLHERKPDGLWVVSCPILRKLECEICKATGDHAHTRSHCPFSKERSVALLLRKTPRRCDGRLRRNVVRNRRK